jgi:hypothetical protein
MTKARVAGAALTALMLAGCAGCAVESQEAKQAVTGSIKPRSHHAEKAAPKNADDTMRAFCAQRHVDYQEGRSPGGATTLEKKQADDRLCEALGRQG